MYKIAPFGLSESPYPLRGRERERVYENETESKREKENAFVSTHYSRGESIALKHFSKTQRSICLFLTGKSRSNVVNQSRSRR